MGKRERENRDSSCLFVYDRFTYFSSKFARKEKEEEEISRDLRISKEILWRTYPNLLFNFSNRNKFVWLKINPNKERDWSFINRFIKTVRVHIFNSFLILGREREKERKREKVFTKMGYNLFGRHDGYFSNCLDKFRSSS